MSEHPHLYIIFATCFLMLFAQSALAQIIKCIDIKGAVTFRDVPCKAGEDAVRLPSPINPAPEKGKATSQLQKSAVMQYQHATIRIDKMPLDHGLGTDVATLKAAKETLTTMDHLSKLTHQQSYASRD